LRHAAVKILVLMAALTSLTFSLPNDPPALLPHPGTGMFLMLSDVHLDPYRDAEVMKKLGANLKEGCPSSGSGSFPNFGSDTNYSLLQSTLEHVVATAAGNHFHYDYVIVTGDFLAHGFDSRYRQCVGGGDEAYRKFSSDTIALVDRTIAQALPGVPVFAALGNNDSDRGDYEKASEAFLQSVGEDWSRAWGNLPATLRADALASFGRAGNYAAPHPALAKHQFVILNTNLWAASNTQACSETDPDPGGQVQWLGDTLEQVKRAGGSATLVMHIPPGINAMSSLLGPPKPFWTDRCTQKFISVLSDYRGVVRQMYAGHIHRDDFRLVTDQEGKPLSAIHILPAVSPIYLENPAVEIGWYDKSTGELRDYAPQYLDLGNPKPAWATEYVFTRAYGLPRPDLATLEDLIRAIHAGNPNSGVGKQYAQYYGVGINMLINPLNWSIYSCAQSEITAARFAECQHAASSQ
jgi:hypothetical protein